MITASANAVEVRFEPVAEGVYAFVGELVQNNQRGQARMI
jgi:hypothetical protein